MIQPRAEPSRAHARWLARQAARPVRRQPKPNPAGNRFARRYHATPYWRREHPIRQGLVRQAILDLAFGVGSAPQVERARAHLWELG